MLKIGLNSANKPKFIYATLFVLIVTCITFYVFKEKEKKLRIYTQNRLTQTTEEKKKVENKLVETVKAKEVVEIELASEKEMSLTLKKELEDRDQQIKATLDKLEREIEARKKAEAQLMIALKEKELLEAKMSNLAQSSKIIELEKIVIKPGSVIKGNITMVNKEYGFVIVNLGSQHNLKVGDILSIYRSDEFIGKVQVERAEELISAAVVLADWQNIEFKENDDAVKTI